MPTCAAPPWCFTGSTSDATTFGGRAPSNIIINALNERPSLSPRRRSGGWLPPFHSSRTYTRPPPTSVDSSHPHYTSAGLPHRRGDGDRPTCRLPWPLVGCTLIPPVTPSPNVVALSPPPLPALYFTNYPFIYLSLPHTTSGSDTDALHPFHSTPFYPAHTSAHACFTYPCTLHH